MTGPFQPQTSQNPAMGPGSPVLTKMRAGDPKGTVGIPQQHPHSWVPFPGTIPGMPCQGTSGRGGVHWDFSSRGDDVRFWELKGLVLQEWEGFPWECLPRSGKGPFGFISITSCTAVRLPQPRQIPALWSSVRGTCQKSFHLVIYNTLTLKFLHSLS